MLAELFVSLRKRGRFILITGHDFRHLAGPDEYLYASQLLGQLVKLGELNTRQSQADEQMQRRLLHQHATQKA